MTRVLYHEGCGGASVTTGLSVKDLSTTRARRVWQPPTIAAAPWGDFSRSSRARRFSEARVVSKGLLYTPARQITPARRGAWWNGGKPPRGVFAGESDEAIPGLLAAGGFPFEEAGVSSRSAARASHRAVATKPARDGSGDDHETTRSGGARFIELHDVRGVQGGDGRGADLRSGGWRGGG